MEKKQLLGGGAFMTLFQDFTTAGRLISTLGASVIAWSIAFLDATRVEIKDKYLIWFEAVLSFFLRLILWKEITMMFYLLIMAGWLDLIWLIHDYVFIVSRNITAVTKHLYLDAHTT
jgi:hypothetical protein